MFTIHIEGVKNIVDGLRNMSKGINPDAQTWLDESAQKTKQQMQIEAPKNTAALALSVTVTVPNWFTRTIEPMAKNILPGDKYALPVETGSGPGYIPNPYSIAQYYGVSERIGWAIAMSIKQKGTPARFFVSATKHWVDTMLESQVQSLLTKIIARYEAG